MQKDFDRWNTEKKRIHAGDAEPRLFFHEREVWWCSLGLNIGVETDGKHDQFERPALIVRKFNADMLWVLPLTSSMRSGKYFREVRHEDGISTAVLSQLRTVSTKRLRRKIGMIPEDEFRAILETLKSLLTIEPLP